MNTKLKRKAILFLDNTLFPSDEVQLASGATKAYFIPSNVTSLMQPLDHAVLESWKTNYRKKLLGKQIGSLEEQGIIKCLKQFILRDVTYWFIEV